MAKFKVKVRKWHKWLALIVGVQILLWTLSGFIMSYFPIEDVRGGQFLNRPKVEKLNHEVSYASPQSVIELFPNKNIVNLELKNLYGQPVYRAEFKEAKPVIVSALTGENLSPLSKERVREIALKLFDGSASIRNIEKLKKAPIEFRGGDLPVWRVNFSNDEETSFYLSPQTGKLLAIRTDLWRLYDFFWMLHIMDYESRSDFNSWWLIAAAVVAVLTSLTGICLYYYSFRKRDFVFWKR